MEIIDSTKQSILIIGGTGFIGSYVVEEALSRQLNVTIISKNLISFIIPFAGDAHFTSGFVLSKKSACPILTFSPI